MNNHLFKGDWDLFRFSLAKKLFHIIYKDYSFTEYGNDWHRWWCFVWGYGHEGRALVGAPDRLFMLHQLLKLTADVPGSLAECGAYRGQSADIILSNSGDDKRLHVFDSFEGLSEPNAREQRWWKKGDFAAAEADFLEMVKLYGQRVSIHKGWIPEKFPEVDGETFSFVHVDVDLAEPTEQCIIFFYPRLEPGGVMLFDDYGFRQCREVKKLVDVCFPPEDIIRLTTGQAFVVKGEYEHVGK